MPRFVLLAMLAFTGLLALSASAQTVGHNLTVQVETPEFARGSASVTENMVTVIVADSSKLVSHVRAGGRLTIAVAADTTGGSAVNARLIDQRLAAVGRVLWQRLGIHGTNVDEVRSFWATTRSVKITNSPRLATADYVENANGVLRDSIDALRGRMDRVETILRNASENRGRVEIQNEPEETVAPTDPLPETELTDADLNLESDNDRSLPTWIKWPIGIIIVGALVVLGVLLVRRLQKNATPQEHPSYQRDPVDDSVGVARPVSRASSEHKDLRSDLDDESEPGSTDS